MTIRLRLPRLLRRVWIWMNTPPVDVISPDERHRQMGSLTESSKFRRDADQIIIAARTPRVGPRRV